MEPNNQTMKHPQIVERTTGPVRRAELVPTDSRVRARAHEIYRVLRGKGEDGDELADWIAAECELKAKRESRRTHRKKRDGHRLESAMATRTFSAMGSTHRSAPRRAP